jgi:predicted nuclease of predicted toxin-antitoxin system
MASTIAGELKVVLIRSHEVSNDQLYRILAVRKKNVLEALSWLCANNPLYGDVTIDQAMDSYADDGIPSAFIDQLVHNNNDIAEGGTYTTSDEDDISGDEPQLSAYGIIHSELSDITTSETENIVNQNFRQEILIVRTLLIRNAIFTTKLFY